MGRLEVGGMRDTGTVFKLRRSPCHPLSPLGYFLVEMAVESAGIR